MSVALQERTIELDFPSGAHGRFDYLWLRDNCPSGFHPETNERVFDLLSVPEDLRAQEANVVGDELHVVWAGDRHRSTYSLNWLESFTSELSSAARTWDATAAEDRPKLAYDDIMSDELALAAWLTQLRDWGFAIVTGAPIELGAILKITGLIGPPRTTNFGTIFDVTSKASPNNNAYTAIKLFAHMDLPNWQRPPDYQFLYCLENQTAGGESIFVDGFEVAERLRNEDPAAFVALSTLPMNFRFFDEAADIRARAPAITVDSQGAVKEIRYSRAIMDTLTGDADDIGALYRAHRRFTMLTRDPALELRLRLKPGEMVGFDNLRVLHGREAFDPNSGFRHLQGCYVDRDYLYSKLRIIERR